MGYLQRTLLLIFLSLAPADVRSAPLPSENSSATRIESVDSGRRNTAIRLGAAGAGFLGVTTALVLWNKHTVDNFNAINRADPTLNIALQQEQRDHLRNRINVQRLLMGVTGGIGMALIAAGGYYWFTGPSEGAAKPVTLGVSVQPNHIAISGCFP
jgi:hypothetical protein